MTALIETIRHLAAENVAAAVCQGYAGYASDYTQTAADVAHIVAKIEACFGRKPRRGEWEEAGFAEIGAGDTQTWADLCSRSQELDRANA